MWECPPFPPQKRVPFPPASGAAGAAEMRGGPADVSVSVRLCVCVCARVCVCACVWNRNPIGGCGEGVRM